MDMQEGHERAEPAGGDDTSPGASAGPSPEATPAPAAQPVPPDVPTTELGTWTLSAGGQGTWEPPPAGGHGGWSAPPGDQRSQPASGYGAPTGGYGHPSSGYGESSGGYGHPSSGYGESSGGYGQPGGYGSSSGYGSPGGGYGPPPGPRRPRRGNHPLFYVLVAVLAAALGAGAVLAFQPNTQPSGSSRGFSPQDIPSPSGNKGNGNTNTSGIDPQAVAARVTPGVVDITASLRYTSQVFEGTGMVLSPSGLVLTNNHVVSGSTALTATVVSSGRKYTAKVVGTDAKDDVALLKLTRVSGLRTVKVGDSDKVSVGPQVVALGNAGGRGGQPTVTSGTITALHRTITAGDSGTRTSETLHDMLQTNALIAEGDSGGPLANAAGYVIGMNTAANTPSAGGPGTHQGFAIPINHALDIAGQMAKGIGSATIHIGQPPFMGIAVASTSSDTVSSAIAPRQQLQQLNQAAQSQFGGSFGGGINSNGQCLTSNGGSPVPRHIAPSGTGTLIAGAFCDAPADSAGMTGGDVILAIDGQTVGAPASLTNILQDRYHPGDRISVTWMDTSGQRHTSPLTLNPGPVK